MPSSDARWVTAGELRPLSRRHRDAGLDQQLDAEAVEHVERLERLALRAIPELAVGQHAVDVEQHEPDAPGALQRGASLAFRSIVVIAAHVR